MPIRLLTRTLGLLLGTVALALASLAVAAEITVDIDDTKVVNDVGDKFHGTNFVSLWNGVGASPAVMKAFSQLNMKLVRYPGGVPAQWYDWQNPPKYGNLRTDAAAWDLAKAGGAELILQTNAANDVTNKDGKFDSTGAHQAGWIAYAKKQGYKVAIWEIGNEPEMDAPKESKGSQEAIFKWYNAKYEEQVKAIKAADPTAKVMGPAATNTWFWWHEKNLEKFLKAEGNKEGTGLAEIISLHWYTDGTDWNKSKGNAQGWADSMTYIQGVIKQYDSRPLPLYITEWNWGGGMNNTSASELGTALGNADIIGMFLRTGVKGQTHFCLQGGNKSWGILDMNADSKPWPTYFALSMAGHLNGKVLSTKCSADEKAELSAYATKDAAGAMTVMLINKTAAAKEVTLKFTSFAPAGKTWRTFTLAGAKGSPKDTEVIYNGVDAPQPQKDALPPPKTGPLGAAVSVAPYSLMVLTTAAASPTPVYTAPATKPGTTK
jgi:hypothetical protein